MTVHIKSKRKAVSKIETVSPLAETMQYFSHVLFLYDITLLVVASSIYRVVRSKSAYHPVADLIVHALLILGVLRGLFFQGVLADTANNAYSRYFNHLFAVLVLHIVLNVLFVFLVYRNRRKTEV